jgi:hypothetical protein
MEVVNVDMNDRQGVITIQADTPEKVLGRDAKELVLKTAAQQGLSRPGLSGGESAYPVNEAGETSDELILGRGGPAAAFRADYRVTASL